MDWVSLDEIEDLARPRVPKMVFDYFASGSERQDTLRENVEAFKRYKLLPRMLRDVSTIDTSIHFLGNKIPMPLLIAPTGFQQMAHPAGEVAMANGARRENVPMVVSTMANQGIENVAASGHPFLLFQLYVLRDPSIMKQMVQDAERLGYRALVVTVDAPLLGKREADHRNRFQVPSHLPIENVEKIASIRQARQAAQNSQRQQQGSGLSAMFEQYLDKSLTWEKVAELRNITSLPIYVKGILSPEDARLAVRHGLDGVIVSNHGARQLDGGVAPIDALPHVARAVQGKIPVLVDGGVRRGVDILKAIALGATAVLVGRPMLYALALGGEDGVVRANQILKKELELNMALCGCSCIADITPDLVISPEDHPVHKALSKL